MNGDFFGEICVFFGVFHVLNGTAAGDFQFCLYRIIFIGGQRICKNVGLIYTSWNIRSHLKYT